MDLPVVVSEQHTILRNSYPIYLKFYIVSSKPNSADYSFLPKLLPGPDLEQHETTTTTMAKATMVVIDMFKDTFFVLNILRGWESTRTYFNIDSKNSYDMTLVMII